MACFARGRRASRSVLMLAVARCCGWTVCGLRPVFWGLHIGQSRCRLLRRWLRGTVIACFVRGRRALRSVLRRAAGAS